MKMTKIDNGNKDPWVRFVKELEDRNLDRDAWIAVKNWVSFDSPERILPKFESKKAQKLWLIWFWS
jgi:hypothetical protein